MRQASCSSPARRYTWRRQQRYRSGCSALRSSPHRPAGTRREFSRTREMHSRSFSCSVHIPHIFELRASICTVRARAALGVCTPLAPRRHYGIYLHPCRAHARGTHLTRHTLSPIRCNAARRHDHSRGGLGQLRLSRARTGPGTARDRESRRLRGMSSGRALSRESPTREWHSYRFR